MEIKIGITAHHNGRFEFKICHISAPADGQTWVQAEKAQLTQECFNQVGRPPRQAWAGRCKQVSRHTASVLAGSAFAHWW